MKSKKELEPIKSSIDVTEEELLGFLNLILSDSDRFKVIKSKNIYTVHFISSNIDSSLMDAFKNLNPGYDLLYFKSIYIDVDNKTVDLVFNANFRMNPDISKNLIRNFVYSGKIS